MGKLPYIKINSMIIMKTRMIVSIYLDVTIKAAF
jgi:hypothetical protein